MKGVSNMVATLLLIVIGIGVGAAVAYYLLHKASASLSEPPPSIRVLSVAYYYNYTYVSFKVSWFQPFNISIKAANSSGYIVCVLGCSGSGQPVTTYCYGSCRIAVNVVYSREAVVELIGRNGATYSTVVP